MGLPDQNQLYAYYLSRCGHHGVRKPHRAVLALLAEDTSARALRLDAEAAERGVQAADLARTEDGDDDTAAAHAQARAAVVPLALQRTVRLTETCGAGVPIYVGARGMLPLLDVLAELPLLQELDLSTVASWYDGDTQRCGVSGNDVVERLCEFLPRWTMLQCLDVRGQPLGCHAAARLLEALQESPSVTEVRMDTSALHPQLLRAIQQTLDAHAQQQAQVKAPPTSVKAREYAVPAHLTALPRLDRKTLRDQQLLRALLEEDANFADVVTEAELGEMVLTARVMTTTEAIFRCGKAGIRGDGVHLFILKSGSLRVYDDLSGFTLHRGDYFGDLYDATLIPCSRLAEEERGAVYALPLASCCALQQCWSRRVEQAWPWLHRTPLLQSVGTWVQLRACTCATWSTSEPSATVLDIGAAAEGAGLFVVCDGAFTALQVRDDGVADFRERNVRATFGRYDVFGVEALVARKRTSSVRIKAGREKNELYRVLAVRGSAVRLLLQLLRPVFASLARCYSLHADLSSEGVVPAAAA